MQEILRSLPNLRPIDLAQPWQVGMPRWPTHPPFLYSLTKLHGDTVLEGGASSAADAIALGTHTGTHIDALGHFSCAGCLHGGHDAASQQSYTGGLREHSIEEVGLIARRGVLFDVAGREGVETLPEDFTITPRHLEAAQSAELRQGDVALVRTGWARLFSSAARFQNDLRLPGVELAGAQWLSERGVFAAGSDTLAFEKTPSPRMEVHVHLLVEKGIHIIEVLNLESLAAAGIAEFLFVAAPLKIAGATGSPLRPFALC